MYTRLVSFTGATNIDAGVDYLRDEVLPVLNAQRGYRGVTASGDRAAGVLHILSLWETEEDRGASDSALGKAREEAIKIVGGALEIENFEQVVEAISKRPSPGCHLNVVRVRMDPASIDANVEWFKDMIAPQISSQPGFCSLRNMVDRQTGLGRLLIASTTCSKFSISSAPPTILMASSRALPSALSLAARSSSVSHSDRMCKTPAARSPLAVTPR